MKTMKTILALLLSFAIATFAVAAVCSGLEYNIEPVSVMKIAAGLVIAPYVIAFVSVVGKFNLDRFGAILSVDFTATNLLEARATIEDALAGRINLNEIRKPMTGGLDAFFASTPMLIAGGAETIASMKNSSAQATKVPILLNLSSSVDAARNCGATEEGDSALKNITFVTVSKGFRMSKLLYANNDIKFQTDFVFNLMQCIDKLHRNLDSTAITTLETNKSAVNDGTINTFNSGLARMNVSLAEKNNFYNHVRTEMMQNDFDGPIWNIGAIPTADTLAYLANQGAGNATNLQYQLGDFKHFLTANVSIPSGCSSANYMIVPGTIGIIPWANQLSRQGDDIGTDSWTTFKDPIHGFDWEMKIKRSCTDRSGTTTGAEADSVIEFRLSAEFAFVTAYSSTTDSGIYKYVQLTT